MAAQVGLDPPLLVSLHDESFALDTGTDAEPLEGEQDAAKIVRPHALNLDLAVGDRCQPDEAADLDVIRTHLQHGTGERMPAFHRHDVGADAVDVCAHGAQGTRHVLHVGFGRGVPEDRRSLGAHGRHQRILGGGHAWLVEEDLAAPKALRVQPVGGADLDGCPERFEGQEVGIQAAPTDHIAARGWQGDIAVPRQQWPGQEDRRADAGAERWVETLRPYSRRIDPERVLRRPGRVRPEIAHQREQGVGPGDGRTQCPIE